MSDNFKHVFNAQCEYLTANRNFIILETTLTDKSDHIYNVMVAWLDGEITDSSWSIGKLPEYSTITIRLWDRDVAETFKDNFRRFVKE